MSAKFKSKCPVRPKCPNTAKFGHTGQAGRLFWNFSVIKKHHQNLADFAAVISRGIGNRKIITESILLFYGKVIVETEN